MIGQLLCLVFGAGSAIAYFQKNELKASILKKLGKEDSESSVQTPQLTDVKDDAYKPSMVGGGIGYVI